MTTTALKNKSKQSVVLVLDHPAFATRASGWQRATASFASAQEDGTRAVQDVRRTYAGSLTIAPGETVKGLHPAIANCSQVPGLVRSGVLVLSDEEEAEQAKQQAGDKPAPKSKISKEER